MEDEHHCAIHHKNEMPESGEYFLYCFECWHIYETADDLIRDFNETGKRVRGFKPFTRAEDIFFCAWCIHDF